ncbi:hypothetical protein ACI7RC_19045 [Brevibacillus sp. B_LB10_24]|uniref:hypothetical protein n=1 Tax=Brevibacillus sp. B_LB10_24 TaxID=3380645 RepID=UPI0038BBC962
MGYELDWRERPMLSPLGGFLIQSRAGKSGNFEVVIAWPSGGLAHFWRENDHSAFRWHGPTFFGRGDYVGATVIESDFRAFSGRLGNLEVLATRSDGTVDHYWRENGGQYVWNGPYRVFDGAGGNPSMAYTGAVNLGGTQHGGSSFYAVAPNRYAGFAYWQRRNSETGRIEWLDLGGTGSVKLDGIGFVMTTIGAASASAGYKYTGPGGNHIVAGVASHLGWLCLYVNGVDSASVKLRGWIDQTVIGRDIFPEVAGEFVGRPCLIQGDYGYREPSNRPFDYGHYGNLELVVPSNRGGILHFWRDCGAPYYIPKPIHEKWSGPVRIPGDRYDEVSLIQSNFSSTNHGNLEMIARQRNQHGFDFFWRDEKMTWHGPNRIQGPGKP